MKLTGSTLLCRRIRASDPQCRSRNSAGCDPVVKLNPHARFDGLHRTTPFEGSRGEKPAMRLRPLTGH